MQKKPIIGLFISLLTCVYLATLTGCASMSEGQCHTADWYQVGFNDGQIARGSQIDAHYSACSEYNVVVDQERYRIGYGDGLRRYCSPNNGWKRGSIGSSYNNFCAADLQAKFVDGYRAGLDYHRLQTKIRELQARKIKYEDKVVDEESPLTRDDKLEYLRVISDLEREIDDLEEEGVRKINSARRQGWVY